MFTGIIQTIGKVRALSKNRLTIESPISSELKKGGSIAVDGVCLSVLEKKGDAFEADVMPETAAKTILKDYKKNQSVNLELPMKMGDRFEGHMVSGHVEGVGIIQSIKKSGNSNIVSVKIPKPLVSYIVSKGSIALNGVSLTIIDIKKDVCLVGLIPLTLESTNLKSLKKGSRVNIETDLMIKYLQKLHAN